MGLRPADGASRVEHATASEVSERVLRNCATQCPDAHPTSQRAFGSQTEGLGSCQVEYTKARGTFAAARPATEDNGVIAMTCTSHLLLREGSVVVLVCARIVLACVAQIMFIYF